MASSSFHIVIIGGGIGGLCLAQALKGAGVSVAVYERNPSPTDWLQGYRININPIGSQALHECLPPALWEAFLATAGRPSAGFGFLTEQLKDLLVIDEELMYGGASDPVHGHHPVSRIALRHVLLAGLDDVIFFGKTFVGYEQMTDGKVMAFFEDGSTALGDVLVAADGANSRVRKQFLPQAQRVETGALAVSGKLILTDETRAWLPRQIATRMNMIMPPVRYFLFNAAFDHAYKPVEALSAVGARVQSAGLNPDLLFERSAEDYIMWGFAAHKNDFPSDVDTLDGPALQQLVMRMMSGWHADLQRIVAESDPASVGIVSLKTSVPIEPWESTHVTLLGDALHNMTPLAGLGANMALRDAAELGRTLIAVDRGERALLPAIHEYEAHMIEHGFAAVRTSMRNTQQAIMSNRMSRTAARTWFRLCSAIPALKRKTFGNRWTKPTSAGR